MGDLDWLGLFAGIKVFDIDKVNGSDFGRYNYSFDGNLIYDFKRKSFARIMNQERNKFTLFDYHYGNFVTIYRSGKNLSISYD